MLTISENPIAYTAGKFFYYIMGTLKFKVIGRQMSPKYFQIVFEELKCI